MFHDSEGVSQSPPSGGPSPCCMARREILAVAPTGAAMAPWRMLVHRAALRLSLCTGAVHDVTLLNHGNKHVAGALLY